MDPDSANVDEQLIDVRNRINNTEGRIGRGESITFKDMNQLDKDRKKEKELWGKHGQIYGDSAFYAGYYPDKEEFEKYKREHGQ